MKKTLQPRRNKNGITAYIMKAIHRADRYATLVYG